MPELDPDEYLHDIWAEVGFKAHGELAPLSWQELMAYAKMTGTRLCNEDWRIIMEMSVSYCNGLAARSPFAKSPVDMAAQDD